MRLGASFRETMSGSYWLLDAPVDERAIAVALEATAGDVRELVRERVWRVAGTIDAEHLASGRPLRGTLGLHLVDERRLPYRFHFAADDGGRYELSGQKEWSWLSPIESMTLLPATLYDGRGEEVGRATLRFDWRADWASWVRSIRLRLSR